MIRFLHRLARRRKAAKVHNERIRAIRIAHPERLILCRRIAR